jgi:hypothetical protein
MYLDQGLTVSGSGFLAFEPVVVSVKLGSTDLLNPSLGIADSNAGGAWTLSVTAVSDVAGIADNTDRLLGSDVVTLLAVGEDGSKASTPIAVVAATPAATAAPSVGASLTVAAPVVAGGSTTVYGAGFSSRDRISIVAITGIGQAKSWGSMGASYLDFDRGGTTGSGDFERAPLTSGAAEYSGGFSLAITAPSVDPGVYTVEAYGADSGAMATAPMIIIAE